MTTSTIQTERPLAPSADDPWRYGWRYVRRPLPLDSEHYERVPLTLQDVLHPELGDCVVHSDRHETDRMYLTQVLRAHLEPSQRAVVLSDVRIVWDLPDLRPHSPDLMVIPGLTRRENWSNFVVADEGGRPALIIELTSPDTRRNDLYDKVAHYEQARVSQYVIIDDDGRGAHRRLRLLGYLLVGGIYQAQSLDEQQRLWLEVAGLWIGLRDDHVVCYDLDGNAIGDYLNVMRAAEAAQARAVEAQARAAEAQARATEAQARAERLAERLRALGLDPDADNP
jgi:Uma2 family endonuclease